MSSQIQRGSYPLPRGLSWGEVKPFLPSLASSGLFDELSFRFARSAGGVIHPPAPRCSQGHAAPRVRASLSDLANPRVRWHEDCSSTPLGVSGTSALHRLFAYLAASQVVLSDPGVEDPIGAFNPLRVVHLIKTIEDYETAARELDLSGPAAEALDTVTREFRARRLALEDFARSPLIKEQILRVCLLEPGVGGDPEEKSFDDILVTNYDRELFYLGITGDLANEEWFFDLLGGYWVFSVASSRSTGARLLQVPRAVLTRFQRALSISDDDFVEVLPSDDASIIDTAIELFRPGDPGPHGTLCGAFAAARVV